MVRINERSRESGPTANVVAQACSLFVSLAEEGWTDGAIVEAVAHRYLDEMFIQHPQIDTLAAGLYAFPVAAGCVARRS